MKVLAVTPWGNACGIADYADQLDRALSRIGAPIQLRPEAETLDPVVGIPLAYQADLVWLNHHAALHSRWLPEHVATIQAKGISVVVTLHDTRAGEAESRNTQQLVGLWEQCNATIVHEPVADMPGVHVIRQGVPPWASPMHYTTVRTRHAACGDCFLQYLGQPILGTVGFNFPWKNYDQLCRVCRDVGWAQVILSNDATEADEDRWKGLNPYLQVVRRFLLQDEAIAYLAGCDATAFCYTCANNGTSGAIRQGIAARRPVYAFRGCRQFRDLWLAEQREEPRAYIQWVDGFDHLRIQLKTQPIPKIDTGMIYLAERDSWDKHAARYYAIFAQVRVPPR